MAFNCLALLPDKSRLKTPVPTDDKFMSLQGATSSKLTVKKDKKTHRPGCTSEK